MARSRQYTRRHRAKSIRHRQRISHALFGGDFFRYPGSFAKSHTRNWRCARDRYERLPDKRETIASIRLKEQMRAYEIERK